MSQDVTTCPMCRRATPAARGECIYCGEALPFSSINALPPQRSIDPADHAFNAVLEPSRSSVNDGVVAALASALQVEPDEAQATIAAGKPVPLARCQTRSEAEMIAALVRTCGLRAVVISDEDLRLTDEILRARRISIEGEALRVHHTSGVSLVNSSEIRLIVLGSLRNTRVDYTEGIRGAGQSGGVLDSAEFRSEETLLDVYASTLETSFRIKADAFDYSGLVRPLSFRSDVNFSSALAALRTTLPNAIFDDYFTKARTLLERAWPARARNESRGFKRTGLAFRAVAQASLTSDNHDQFERYSRMMFLFTTKAQSH